MPSFTRRVASTAKPPPPGTHPSPSIPTLNLLSTGLPSLDDLLGGGLPLGSTLLVLAPDNQSAWSRLVERYWIAQGLILGQRSLVVAQDDDGTDLVKGCMWVDERVSRGAGAGRGLSAKDEEGDGASESDGEGLAEVGQGRGGTMIAWRYEKMKKYNTTVAASGGCSSSPLTLTTTIPIDILNHLHSTGTQSYIPLEPGHPSTTMETSEILLNALRRIHDELEKADSDVALRITIHELGSLDWGDNVTSQQVHRFLHALRGMIRNRSASALITLPAFLAQSQPSTSRGTREEWIKSLSWAVDGCIELRGFADDPTLAPLFPHSHGLLTLHSFPKTHSLLPSTLKHSSLLGVSQSASTSASQGGAGENNLSFRLKRKQFVLETLHLGVEGGVGERRTEPVSGGVGAVLGGGPSMGVESPSGSGSGSRSGSVIKGKEGAESIIESGSASAIQSGSLEVHVPQHQKGVERPRGPIEGKRIKQRARVRFGGEEVEPEKTVEVEQDDEDNSGHDHSGDGHSHDHVHNHGPQSGPVSPGSTNPATPKPTVRHDRMDLYEF